MHFYLCSRSAFTIHSCRIMIHDILAYCILKETDLPTILGLSAYADGILLDYNEFSRTDIELILKQAGRRCKIMLLMDAGTQAMFGRDFQGRACCLDLFAPKEELQKKLEKTLLSVKTGREETNHLLERTERSGFQQLPNDPFSRYKRKSFLERVKLIAQTKADILLLGESGAGKSWLAEKIYAYSGRKGNFLSESLANIPHDLFESELFGTVAGAYTDAENKMGLLEATGTGTLFLDEIGELPLKLQSKLFATLDRRTFRRMGSLKEQSFEGRLIFATNKDLEKAVKEKSFREELFHRISTVTLRVPPLREHSYDIPSLASQFAEDEGKSLAPDAVEKLLGYHYPGNIRELKNIVRRSCLLSRRNTLKGSDISFEKAL